MVLDDFVFDLFGMLTQQSHIQTDMSYYLLVRIIDTYLLVTNGPHKYS